MEESKATITAHCERGFLEWNHETKSLEYWWVHPTSGFPMSCDILKLLQEPLASDVSCLESSRRQLSFFLGLKNGEVYSLFLSQEDTDKQPWKAEIVPVMTKKSPDFIDKAVSSIEEKMFPTRFEKNLKLSYEGTSTVTWCFTTKKPEQFPDIKLRSLRLLTKRLITIQNARDTALIKPMFTLTDLKRAQKIVCFARPEGSHNLYIHKPLDDHSHEVTSTKELREVCQRLHHFQQHRRDLNSKPIVFWLHVNPSSFTVTNGKITWYNSALNGILEAWRECCRAYRTLSSATLIISGHDLTALPYEITHEKNSEHFIQSAYMFEDDYFDLKLRLLDLNTFSYLSPINVDSILDTWKATISEWNSMNVIGYRVVTTDNNEATLQVIRSQEFNIGDMLAEALEEAAAEDDDDHFPPRSKYCETLFTNEYGKLDGRKYFSW